MKKLTSPFLFLAVWMLIAGEYLFCAVKMAGKHEFLTVSEAAGAGHLAIILAALFLIFALLGMTSDQTHPVVRCLKAFSAALPVWLTAEIFGFFYPKLTLMKGASTVKMWFLIRWIGMGVAAIVAAVILFTAVADAATAGRRRGVLKGLLRMLAHPLHLLLFTLLLVLSLLASNAVHLAVLFFEITSIRYSFATNMVIFLAESLLATAVLYGDFCFMKKKALKWEEKAKTKQSQKEQKNPNGMNPNGMNPNGMNPNSMIPNSMNPNGMNPNGMNPNGMTPNGMNQNGMTPNAESGAKPRLKDQISAGFSVVSLNVTGVVFIVCVILLLPLWKEEKVSKKEKLLNEIKEPLAYCTGNLMSGKMNEAYLYAARAQRRVSAFKAYTDGEEYTLEQITRNEPEDVFGWILYLQMTGKTDELEKYVVEVNPTRDDLKMLLFEQYGKKKKSELTKQQKGYQEEYLRECIDTMTFTSRLAQPVTSKKTMDQLNKTFEKDYASLDAYVKSLDYLCDVGKNGEVTDVGTMLSLAEENPDDVTMQYLAGVIAAAGVSDNTGYLEQARNVVKRFVELSETDKNVKKKQLNQRKQRAVELLIKLRGYEEAMDLLEEIDTSKDPQMEQQLGLLRLYCADCNDDIKTCYKTAKELLEEGVENPHVYYFYGLGALKSEKPQQMTSALEEVAYMLCDEETTGDELLQTETVFFTMMEYAVLNDNATWTDYTYGYYNNMEEDDKEELDEFLYYYMEAMNDYFNTREYEKALEMINEVLDLREDLCYAYYLKGAILYSLQEFEESAESYQLALEVNPDQPIFLYALANTYDAMEDYGAAYEASGRVQQMIPLINHEQDWYGLGVHNRNLFNGLAGRQGGEE